MISSLYLPLFVSNAYMTGSEQLFIPDEKYRILGELDYVNTMLGPIVCNTVPIKSEQERKLSRQVIEIDTLVAKRFGDTWQDKFPKLAINNFELSVIEDQITAERTSFVINHLLRLGFVLGADDRIDLFHTDIVSWLESQSIFGYELDNLETAPGESVDDYNQFESINNRLIAICHFGAKIREQLFGKQTPSLMSSNSPAEIKKSAFDDFVNGELFGDEN